MDLRAPESLAKAETMYDVDARETMRDVTEPALVKRGGFRDRRGFDRGGWRPAAGNPDIGIKISVIALSKA